MNTISAENQLDGVVRAVHSGAVNDEIEIVLRGGQPVAVTVTRASTTAMQLVAGKRVTALLPANQIILSARQGTEFSADNQLTGVVSARRDGAVSCEIDVQVGDGLTLTAMLTEGSAGEMALSEGVFVNAWFNAANMILFCAE